MRSNQLLSLIHISVALELYKNIRLENFIVKKRNELCREYLFEQLVVMQRDSFLTIVSDLITSMGYTVVKPHPFGLICSCLLYTSRCV